MKMTIAEWAVKFNLVQNVQEAEELCYIGNLRLNGNSCSSNNIPESGDLLSTLTTNYQYQIPNLESVNA
jgi:hypothetical protein